MPNWIDVAISGFLLISILYSFFRGIIREIFSVAALVAGYLCASRLYLVASTHVEPYFQHKLVSEIVCFLGLFLTAAFLVLLVGKLVVRVVRTSDEISWVDRVLGGFIGFLKGGFVIALLLIPLGFIPSLRNDLSTESELAPIFVQGSKVLTQWIYSDTQTGPNQNASSTQSTLTKRWGPTKEKIQEKMGTYMDQIGDMIKEERTPDTSPESSSHQKTPSNGTGALPESKEEISPEDQSKMEELLDTLISPTPNPIEPGNEI